MDASDMVVITVTAADEDWLTGFVRALVADGLVACGNVIPGVRSIYRWEGTVADEREALAVLHTAPERVAKLRERVARDHPYDVPQFVVLTGSAAAGYAQWVRSVTLGGPKPK